jgi:hypothetical protein
LLTEIQKNSKPTQVSPYPSDFDKMWFGRQSGKTVVPVMGPRPEKTNSIEFL